MSFLSVIRDHHFRVRDTFICANVCFSYIAAFVLWLQQFDLDRV